MSETLQISMSHSEMRLVIESTLAGKLIPEGVPSEMLLDARPVAPSDDWKWQLNGTESAHADWPDGTGLSVSSRHVVKIHCNAGMSISAALLLLPSVEFELATLDQMRRTWRREFKYRPPGFSANHFPHGSLCAFKGEGHNRLVSRRWLEHGPWRLIRDEDTDLSFVQFHDLNADPETALEQAKPGHQRMGITDHGGFIQKRYVYETDFDGIYLPDEQILEIVVFGREIPDVELLDAAALRHYQGLGDDKPLNNIRYVFMTENEARQNLHELWLRELECWAIVDGEKVRLDDGYVPPAPVKPAWVQALEG